MAEAYVNLDCPTCDKVWEAPPHDLPGRRDEFTCPDCDAVHPLAEFARSQRDLEVIDQFA